MTSDVTVQFNERKLKQVQRMLRAVPSALPKVVSRAINKTAASGRTRLSREFRTQINLTAGAIKTRLNLQKATTHRWQGTLGISDKRFGLIRFAARQTQKGVSYKIDKASGRSTINRAFVTTTHKGVTGVFIRTEKNRYPLMFLRGPSLGYVLEKNPQLAAVTLSDAYLDLEKNIDAQVHHLYIKMLNK